MDAVNIDINPSAETFQHTTLQKLDLTQSDVADAEVVARIIFFVLPRVDRILTRRDHWNASIVFQREWDEVNKHLDYLKSSAVIGSDITATVAKS
jgi:hypothetical protein